MRKKRIYIITLFAAIMLSACNNEVDVDILKGDAKLVLYCFPNTECDTTIISLSASIPANRNVENIQVSAFAVTNPTISYRVNGTERAVMYAKENTGSVPAGKYYVTGHHQCGDVISIKASAEGYPDILAETTIPEKPEIKGVNSVYVYYDSNEYLQRQVAIGDDPHTDDFYALSYEKVSYQKVYGDWDSEEMTCDTVKKVSSDYLNIDDEPALSPMSKLDEFFDYDNTFYQNFYIFNDHLFTDGQYTLRLNTLDFGYYESSVVSRGFCVKLYKISSDYYHFVKSVNDNRNSLLGDYGLAPLSPIQNNVKGGLGCVGGYCAVEYEEVLPYHKIQVSQSEIKCDLNAHHYDIELLSGDSWIIDHIAGGRGNNYSDQVSIEKNKFDAGWCTAVIPSDNPRILHVEIQAASKDSDKGFERSYILAMKVGHSTVFITIRQTDYE